MKLRANILSGGPGGNLDWVGGLTKPVPVFHDGLGRVVGTASGYEVQGEDLWATLDLEEGVPRAARAAGIVTAGLAGTTLVAVFFTDKSRAEIADLFALLARGQTPGSTS